MPVELSILDAIIKKNQAIVDKYMPVVREAQGNIEIAQQAKKLIAEEGTGQQEALSLEVAMPVEVISDKYSAMSMPEAFADILLPQKEYIGAEEIFTDLQKHGFKSDSKNLKRDVYTRLFRLSGKDLAGKGILVSRKEGAIKKYAIEQTKKEESQESTLAQ